MMMTFRGARRPQDPALVASVMAVSMARRLNLGGNDPTMWERYGKVERRGRGYIE